MIESTIKIIVSVLLFLTAIIFIISNIVIYRLNRQLISLGTYRNLLDDMQKTALEHDNYVNFMKRKGLDTGSVDKDVFMSIYLSGKYDGLARAETLNKNVVEKILKENFND